MYKILSHHFITDETILSTNHQVNKQQKISFLLYKELFIPLVPLDNHGSITPTPMLESAITEFCRENGKEDLTRQAKFDFFYKAHEILSQEQRDAKIRVGMDLPS